MLQRILKFLKLNNKQEKKMASWGNDPNSATNKPKFLLDNEITKYRREDSYATNQGWVMRAGSPATGNGNINAAPEILVAIGGLAGLSANAGFKLEAVNLFLFAD